MAVIIADWDEAGVKPPIFSVEAFQARFVMEGDTGGYRFLKNFEDTGKIFRMYDINCSPILQLFRRPAKILDHLAIDGFELTIRGRDRNKTGYPIDCRTQTSFAFAQRFLRANDSRHVCAGAAIAEELSVCIEHRLATRLHVHGGGALAASGEIYEVAERLVRVHCSPDFAPLLRLSFKVKGTLPGRGAKPGRRAGPECIRSQHRQFVVRPHLPKPIGRSFGIVAEPLFALAKRLLRALALGNVNDAGKAPGLVFSCVSQRDTRIEDGAIEPAHACLNRELVVALNGR